jgi:hypothetical protein
LGGFGGGMGVRGVGLRWEGDREIERNLLGVWNESSRELRQLTSFARYSS